MIRTKVQIGVVELGLLKQLLQVDQSIIEHLDLLFCDIWLEAYIQSLEIINSLKSFVLDISKLSHPRGFGLVTFCQGFIVK